MHEHDGDAIHHEPEKAEFEEPTLTYIAPELKQLGKVEDLTKQGFFGTFSP